MVSNELLDFFDKRAILGLSTGASVVEVETVLGKADDIALLGRKRKTRILKYGQVEFYFNPIICDMIQFTFYGSIVEPLYEKELLQLFFSKKIEYQVLHGLSSDDQIAYITANQIIVIVDIKEKEVKKIYFVDKTLATT